MQTIFYGAGEFARKNYTKWVEAGETPVCFVDVDVAKHNTKFASADGATDLNILSLDEAIIHYPDYVIYIALAPNNMMDVTEYLLEQGIVEDRIKYPVEYERRRGCSWLGGAPTAFLAYTGDRICTCCYVERDFLMRTESIEQDIINAHKFIDERIDDLRHNRPNPCEECPNLIEGIFLKSPRIDRIGINSYLDKTVCNFKCIYCGVEDAFHKTKDGLESPLELVKKIHKAVVNAESPIAVSLSAGELTVSPWCDEVLEFIENKKWYKTSLNSNGYVYKEKITELIQKEIISAIVVSLDAGTRETFAKIKGVDGWDRVISNLEKYAIFPDVLQLKYIMLRGVNDNREDILGFIDVCKRLNTHARLSRDFLAERKLSESEMDSCLLFIREAKRVGVRVLLLSDFIYNKSDRKVLEQALRSE